MIGTAILIVDDEEHITRTLARSLRDQFTIFTANNAEDALTILAREDIAVILTDQRMADISGVDLLERARQLRPDALGILISGYSDITAVIDALNLGTVRGYLPKPWDIDEVRRQVTDAAHQYEAIFRNREALRDTVEAVREAQKQIDTLREQLDQIGFSYQSLAASLQATYSQEISSLEQLSSSAPAMVTANSFGLQMVREAVPAEFEELVQKYSDLLAEIIDQSIHGLPSVLSSQTLRAMAEHLGFLRAGPRDVIDVHTTGLKRLSNNVSFQKAQVIAQEGRLLVLELMGYLVAYYRSRSILTREPFPIVRSKETP